VLPSERFEPDGPSTAPLTAGTREATSKLFVCSSLGFFAAPCSWLLIEASTPRPDLRRLAVVGAMLIVGAGEGERGRSRLGSAEGASVLARAGGGWTEVETTWSKSESRPGQLGAIGAEGDATEKTLSGMGGQ